MGIHKNDSGTRIEFDVGIKTSDIDTATLTLLYPSSKKEIFDLELEDDSTIVFYKTDDDTLSESGMYQLQVKIKLNDGFIGNGDILKMQVLETL